MLHATARRYASHAPPPSKDAQHHTVFSTRLSLPTPEPLVARLMMLGIDKSSAEQVSSLLARAIVRLKDSFEADYQRRLETLRPRAQYFQDSKFSTSFSATYLTIYTKTVRSWAEYLLHDVTPRLIRAQAQHRAEDNSTNTHHRRPFNQGAIPILEQTFSRNPFPTRLEKYDLAFQCDMEYRQIHVWFQNRRSRLRKDGKELKKPVPRDRLLQDIEDSIVVSLFPHCAEDGDDKDDDDWSSVRHDVSSDSYPSMKCSLIAPLASAPCRHFFRHPGTFSRISNSLPTTSGRGRPFPSGSEATDVATAMDPHPSLKPLSDNDRRYVAADIKFRSIDAGR
ncbi:hypothetical protein C8Q80DRAFT_1092969 [Daedaleopsis nitida]|nr:hypothetical protein C8Q80DRAFT_1092969 [Daedaleopsis nitida]